MKVEFSILERRAILVAISLYLALVGLGASGTTFRGLYAIDDIFSRFEPPSASHFLGTDYYRRDVFSLFVKGAVSAFVAGTLALFPYMATGITLGVVSGYFEGKIARTCRVYLDLFDSFPKLILILILIGLIGNNVWITLAFFGFISAPKLATLIRLRIESLKKQDFIDASRVLGIPDRRIILNHLLWHNSREILFYQALFIFATAIMVETSLSFIHLGFSQDSISWGYMLFEAMSVKEKTLLVWPFSPAFHIKGALVVGALFMVNWLVFRFSQKIDPTGEGR